MKKVILLSVWAVLTGAGSVFGQNRTIFDKADFTVEHPDSLNSIASDISPCLAGNTLYYSSVRKAYWEKENRLKKNTAFYNQYQVPLTADMQVVEGIGRKPVAGLQADYHQGPVAWCAATGELFVTQSNTLDPDSVKKMLPRTDIRLQLAIMKNRSGVWEKQSELPFNDKRYHFAHPAISQRGDTLVFSSDMPGGKGKSDLYMSIRTKGQWSSPVNLGDKINTPGNEMFPTFLPGGLLSFASNGHPGCYGLLDIWYTRFPEMGEVKNAGDKINSPFDDFGLIIEPGLKTGYFASNRPGKGSDDIYRVDIRLYLNTLRVVSYDELTKKTLAETRVELRDASGKTVDMNIADQKGAVEFQVEPEKKFQVYADKTGYVSRTKDITINAYSDQVQQEDIYLIKAAPYLSIRVIDKDTRQPIPTATVQISRGEYDPSELSRTGEWVKMKLRESTAYTFTVSADKYYEKTAQYTSEGKSSGQYELVVELEKLEAGRQIILEDLYYDLNKYNIRPDAALVLDKLVKILKENPDINIEVGSHTDSRATAAYNLKLSQNRSESVVNYLVSKGISRKRLVPKGYGESQLVNKCADGVPCTEQEHQANRRTVIEILDANMQKIKRGDLNIYYF